MADTKITALTALTGADPANDVIPIVDVSDTTMAASGTTKKISVNNILGASGTATLASATITGDLTVRTNKLAVTSAGVGFGTTTPSYPAHFRTTSPVIAIQDDTSAATGVGGTMNFLGFTSGTSGANIFAQIKGVKTSGSAGGEYQVFTSDSAGNSIQRYLIDSTGVSTWSVGGSTAMTLNSTGLGVGGSPASKLSIFAGVDGDVGFFRGGSTRQLQIGTGATAGYLNTDNASTGFELRTNGVARAYFNNSGNVGIGVTPVNKLTIGTGTFNADTVSGSASLYATVSAGLVVLADGLAVATRGGVNRLIANSAGDIISSVTGTAPSLTDNGFMVFNLTSNTNLRISVRGTDGVTRTANLTLA